MSLHPVALAACKPQPWRNGGGQTRELLVWPPHSVGDTWELRVSVADIERSGPFSAFPGVERWFAVLEGTGVRLSLAQGERTLGPDDEPLHFPGEDRPHCHLLGDPSRDLNLMLRRDAGSGGMKRARRGEAIEGPTRWRGLYTADAVRLEVDGVAEPLAAGTLVWTESQDATVWRLLDAGRAWWMTLE